MVKMVRRRRGGRKPRRVMRKRQYGARRRVSGRLHSVKRIATEAFIRNTNVGGTFTPTLVSAGASSFFQSSPVTSPVLPGNWEFTMSSQFQLSSVYQPSDLTNLFDRYKIVGVQLKIHYLQNVGSPQQVPNVGAVYSNLPTIHYAFDGDDANINTKEQILQKGYCHSRVLNANRPTTIFLKPRVTKEIFNSPVTTGYSSEKACWLDANSSSVPHFGMKFAITDWCGGETSNAIRITPTYYLQFRDTQ